MRWEIEWYLFNEEGKIKNNVAVEKKTLTQVKRYLREKLKLRVIALIYNPEDDTFFYYKPQTDRWKKKKKNS